MIPNRSERRPMSTAPKPKPIIVTVYEKDASARATPKSACTAGSATTTDHMPAPPIVERRSATPGRIHAYDDSTCASSRSTAPEREAGGESMRMLIAFERKRTPDCPMRVDIDQQALA